MKSLGYISALSAAVLLSACGGSSSGGSSNNGGDGITDYCGERLELIFPEAYSATLSDSITVRGTSSCATIDSISINGIAATSADDFANWQANIALQPGRNSIQAEVKEGDETHSVVLAAIESNELLYSPEAITTNAAGSILYMADNSRRHILKIDTATGARSIVSSAATTEGDYPFGNMAGIALNEADNLLYVASRHIENHASTNTGIIAVNLTDGSRTLVHDPAELKGGDTTFNSRSLVYDAERERLYLSDTSEIFWIDLSDSGTSGKMEILSDNTTPNATNAFASRSNIDMVLDSTNKRLIVADGQLNQILAVNLDETGVVGARTILFSGSDESNTLDNIADMTLKDANTVLIADVKGGTNSTRIFEFNLASNTLTEIIDSADITDQRELPSYSNIAYSASRNRLWVSNYTSKSVAEIDLTQKDYSILASNIDSQVSGELQRLDDLSRHALDADNQEIYYAVKTNSMYKLNLATGKRTLVEEDLREEGINGDATESMGYDPLLKAVIVTGDLNEDISDTDFGNVVAWPTDGSDAYTITDSATDTGTTFEKVWDWVRLNDTHGIAVDDTSSPSRYYQTEISTGLRTEIIPDLTNAPAGLEVEDMEISLDKRTLYVTDDEYNSELAGLYAIDLSTKVVSVVTNGTFPDDGNAFRLEDPEALAMASDGQHVYVADNNRSALVKVNLTTGSRETLIYESNETTNSWAERIQGISVDHDKQVLYTSCSNANVVLMMDEISNEWVMIAE